MTQRPIGDATLILERAARGEAGAAEDLIPLVYDELRALGRRFLGRERPDHTLQPTALVHEAFLRLVDQSRVDWKGKTHFRAIAARQMRRVLVDHWRAHRAVKRGKGWAKVTLEGAVSPGRGPDYEALDLEEALQELSRLNERHARIVELRFYGGLTLEEVGEALGLSPKTVEKDWRMARAWLQQHLTAYGGGAPAPDGEGAR